MRSGGNNFNYFLCKTDQIGKFHAVHTYAYVLSGGFGALGPLPASPLGYAIGCHCHWVHNGVNLGKLHASRSPGYCIFESVLLFASGLFKYYTIMYLEMLENKLLC